MFDPFEYEPPYALEEQEGYDPDAIESLDFYEEIEENWSADDSF